MGLPRNDQAFADEISQFISSADQEVFRTTEENSLGIQRLIAGVVRNGRASYCDADIGYPFGSSASNLDKARFNAIYLNQIFKLSPALMIRIDATPNYVEQNETVFSRISRTF
ncbi:MAG: hypothetical protein IPK04_01935 [Bdellovibrionales bacterium]|nr:hypothetical protein [Bdellovibrionales bacterium]